MNPQHLSPDLVSRMRHSRDQKPPQSLAAVEDVKPWQLAFSAGWQSFMRQSQKRTEDLAFHPSRAIAAPKQRPQKEATESRSK